MTKKKEPTLKFAPVDGVYVKVEQEKNDIGLEVSEDSGQKNEGIVLSEEVCVSDKKTAPMDLVKAITKGKKIQFLEGYPLKNGVIFVRLDKIIGVSKE